MLISDTKLILLASIQMIRSKIIRRRRVAPFFSLPTNFPEKLPRLKGFTSRLLQQHWKMEQENWKVLVASKKLSPLSGLPVLLSMSEEVVFISTPSSHICRLFVKSSLSTIIYLCCMSCQWIVSSLMNLIAVGFFLIVEIACGCTLYLVRCPPNIILLHYFNDSSLNLPSKKINYPFAFSSKHP